MHICIAETRRSAEVPLKLTLLSVAAYNQDARIHLSYPAADDAFVRWLGRVPQARLTREPLSGAYGWNIKPHALLNLLEHGIHDAVWIDSDVIVTRKLRLSSDDLTDDVFVVTEEALYGPQDPDAVRARGWGLRIGRTLPFAANTGVIRATRQHVPLLRAWRNLLESSEYRAAQQLPWNQRPRHLFGDQDVLTALLTSAEFARVPLRFLRRGKDIIQYYGPFGYTLEERARHVVGGMPTFLHAQVAKPWESNAADAKNARELFDHVYLESSPYTLAARRYRPMLEADASWMEPRHPLSRVLRLVGFNYPPLVGLPLAMIAEAFLLAKRAIATIRSKS